MFGSPNVKFLMYAVLGSTVCHGEALLGRFFMPCPLTSVAAAVAIQWESAPNETEWEGVRIGTY